MNSEQKIKQHIYTYSKKISNEVGDHLGFSFEAKALDLIAEFTYKKLGLYGADLEAFQKHARRSTISSEDVKLLVRRNDSLSKMVNEKIQFIQANGSPEIKKKTKASTSSN